MPQVSSEYFVPRFTSVANEISLILISRAGKTKVTDDRGPDVGRIVLLTSAPAGTPDTRQPGRGEECECDYPHNCTLEELEDGL